MDQVRGMTEGADFHAQAAIGADYAPVVQAGFNLQRPFFNLTDIDFIALGDGTGGANIGASFAFYTEILNAESDWFIRY